jgi:hypothetical protein
MATKLPPITLSYSGGTATFDLTLPIKVSAGSAEDYLTDQYWYSHPEYYGTIAYPDLNGDGRADLCYRYEDGIRCALNTGSGQFGQFSAVARGPAWSNAAGWNAPQYYSTISYPDINGDGRSDICGRDRDGIICYLNTGDTGAPFDLKSPIRFPDTVPFDREGRWSDANGWADRNYYSTIQFPDVNGDGKADVCGRTDRVVVCFVSTGRGFTRSGFVFQLDGADTKQFRSDRLRFPDINGDGKADVCYEINLFNPSSGDYFELLCRLNNGSGFGTTFQASILPYTANQPAQFPDVNGDGKADLCFTSCLLSTGNGFSFSIIAFLPDEYRKYSKIFFPDLNGDGKADVCVLLESTSNPSQGLRP